MNIAMKLCSERLRKYKQLTEFTQDQLAEKFGVDPGTIGNWLHGRCEMRADSLQTLVRFEAEFLMGPKSPLSDSGKHAFRKNWKRA